MSRRILTGTTSGQLTVLKENGKYVYCQCSCGVAKRTLRGNFMAGYTQSCGCLQKRRTSEVNLIHGARDTQLYTIWQAMKRRCYNPHHRAYPRYGGKGIKVCPDWQDFVGFYTDMLEGYSPGLTLDREDSTKDYSKGNCRWLTKKENSSRRDSHG